MVTLARGLFVPLVAAAIVFSACGRDSATSRFFDVTEPANANNALVIDADTYGVTVSLATSDYELSPATLSGERYERLVARGLQHDARPGEPIVPVMRKLVAVPTGMSARLEILERDDVLDIEIAHDLAFEARDEVHGGAPIFVERNQAAYERRYGAELANLGDSSFAGSQKVAWITLTPFFYDAAQRTLSVTRRFKVRVHFEAAPLSYGLQPVAPNGDGILTDIVVNPEALPSHRAGVRPRILQPIDVIIASTTHRDAIAPLVAYKREHGREVREHYVDRPTTSAVLDIIKAEHRAAAISHVILVGSIDQIPSHRLSGIWSDLPYSLLDSGNVPDASIARIPAQTAAETAAYVAKAIARHSSPRDVEKFLMTAGSDTSLGCPANVDAISRIVAQHRPGASLQKLYRARGATQAQILAAYGDGPNVAVYDGHGDHTGMTEIPFLIQHLTGLLNRSLPIILDIACLNANWPSNGATRRNFAESVLLVPEHGAAGIVAAGGNSGGHEFFQGMATHMVRGRADGTSSVPDEIGRIVLAAKIEASYGDNYMFGFYGDPALAIFGP